jgi:hypothetical protein
MHDHAWQCAVLKLDGIHMGSRSLLLHSPASFNYTCILASTYCSPTCDWKPQASQNSLSCYFNYIGSCPQQNIAIKVSSTWSLLGGTWRRKKYRRHHRRKWGKILSWFRKKSQDDPIQSHQSWREGSQMKGCWGATRSLALGNSLGERDWLGRATLIHLCPKSQPPLPSAVQGSTAAWVSEGWVVGLQTHFSLKCPESWSQEFTSTLSFKGIFYFPANLLYHHWEDLPYKRLINNIVKKPRVHSGLFSTPERNRQIGQKSKQGSHED